jgi:diguanylate cyclase (GGDEF)-like protein
MKIGAGSPASRIAIIAVGMLAATSVIVGAAAVAVMQDRLETAVSVVLSDTLDDRSRLFVSLVELRESQMHFISTQPGLKYSLRQIAARRDVARETAAVQAVLNSFIDAGFSGLAYEDDSGLELARAGQFAATYLLRRRIATPLQSELFWTDRFVLRTRIAIHDSEGPLGTMLAEQPLPISTQLMRQDGNLGETGETALCFSKGEGMSCFPQRFNPAAFDLPLNGADGKPLPMSYALQGKTGLVETRDYRKQQVIAAYGPVGGLGLGMVVKMDAAELLAPVHRNLLLIVAICVPLIGGGALLMRRQVLPMAQKMAQAEKDAQDTHVRLNLALDASRVTVWETDMRTGETILSEAWADLLDRPPGETHTTVAELSALVHPEEIAELNGVSMDVVRGKRDSYSVEHRVLAASGHWKWILSRGQVVERDPATGMALRLMGTNLDITERKRSEIEITQLANYDSLTGAANRSLFSDRLQRAIARNRRSGGRAALMYLDIDKFKGVNDSLGHAAGDALLQEFAARLRACVRATDTVGRLGGDEFAVLLEDMTEAGTAARVADTILEAMRKPVSAEGHALVVTTSIGVVTFGADAADEPLALAKRVDAALYEAKAAGRNTYRVAA